MPSREEIELSAVVSALYLINSVVSGHSNETNISWNFSIGVGQGSSNISVGEEDARRLLQRISPDFLRRVSRMFEVLSRLPLQEAEPPREENVEPEVLIDNFLFSQEGPGVHLIRELPEDPLEGLEPPEICENGHPIEALPPNAPYRCTHCFLSSPEKTEATTPGPTVWERLDEDEDGDS